MSEDFDFQRWFPYKCCAEACDGDAVAVAVESDDRWLPVCALHSQGRKRAGLEDLLTSLPPPQD